MQQRRDDPAFRKSKQDDLDNMKAGIIGYKGHVHYHCGRPVNQWIDELKDLSRKEFYQELSHRMDREIHAGYRIYASNRIALDILNGDNAQAGYYTALDKQRFLQYIDGQLAKITIRDKDEPFLRETILNMYANPLRNLLNRGTTS